MFCLYTQVGLFFRGSLPGKVSMNRYHKENLIQAGMSAPCSLHCRSTSFLLRPGFCCWADRGCSFHACCVPGVVSCGECANARARWSWGIIWLGFRGMRQDNRGPKAWEVRSLLSCCLLRAEHKSFRQAGTLSHRALKRWSPSFPAGFLYHWRVSLCLTCVLPAVIRAPFLWLPWDMEAI